MIISVGVARSLSLFLLLWIHRIHRIERWGIPLLIAEDYIIWTVLLLSTFVPGRQWLNWRGKLSASQVWDFLGGCTWPYLLFALGLWNRHQLLFIHEAGVERVGDLFKTTHLTSVRTGTLHVYLTLQGGWQQDAWGHIQPKDVYCFDHTILLSFNVKKQSKTNTSSGSRCLSLNPVTTYQLFNFLSFLIWKRRYRTNFLRMLKCKCFYMWTWVGDITFLNFSFIKCKFVIVKLILFCFTKLVGVEKFWRLFFFNAYSTWYS